MLSDIELKELLEDLHHKDVAMRVATLRDIWHYPTGDERVLPYLEALLEDSTMCVIFLPYQYGEIRWLAAHALAAERKALGVQKPVELLNAISPLDTETFSNLCRTKNADNDGVAGGVEGVLQTMTMLRDKNAFSTHTLRLNNN